MYDPSPIFAFVRDRQEMGQAVVLVTIAEASASSSRNPGAHLAVAEDGAIAGSLSGGCIEAAVATEALDVLAAGRPRLTRYGQGSRFIDIRLPCGGSLDLLFSPLTPSSELGKEFANRIRARSPFRLFLPLGEGQPAFAGGEDRFDVTLSADHLDVNHIAPLRIALFGHGAAVETVAALGRSIGMETIVHTPDRAMAARTSAGGVETHFLTTPDALPDMTLDRWTAAILLFHDHDWEPPILARLLGGESFFIGAMGSRKAHEARRDALRRRGVADTDILRITGPIGLIPSMRDPETLGVSILAQVIERYNQAFLERR